MAYPYPTKGVRDTLADSLPPSTAYSLLTVRYLNQREPAVPRQTGMHQTLNVLWL